MKQLRVNLGGRTYPVVIGTGVLERAGRLAQHMGLAGPPFVIGDSRVMKMYGDSLVGSLRRAYGKVPIVRMPGGERSKNHATLLRLYDALIRKAADRGSCLLAFGGGVVGDVAGFAAATFMRGVPYINVPTTLMAQVDSAVGGKVGINLAQGKNLVGAFHQPKAVWSDTGVLKSLPVREISSGLSEVIKCGAIASESLVGYLEEHLEGIRRCETRELTYVIHHACRIKADVVALDETERGHRMVLNFGHTFGHALEASTGYRRFRHGEAVAWGMLAALAFGCAYGVTAEDDARRLCRLIRRVGWLPPLRGVDPALAWKAFERDKKFRGADLRIVLLARVGQAEIIGGLEAARLRKFMARFLAAQGDVEEVLSGGFVHRNGNRVRNVRG